MLNTQYVLIPKAKDTIEISDTKFLSVLDNHGSVDRQTRFRAADTPVCIIFTRVTSYLGNRAAAAPQAAAQVFTSMAFLFGDLILDTNKGACHHEGVYAPSNEENSANPLKDYHPDWRLTDFPIDELGSHVVQEIGKQDVCSDKG